MILTASLAAMQQGVKNLYDYISFNSTLNKFLAKARGDAGLSGDEFLSLIFASSGDVSKKKVLEYNSYIITLYGLLERFLEDVIEEYFLQIVRLEPEYKKLPQSIQDSHFKLSAEVLGNWDNPKFRVLDRAQFIENLANCEKHNRTQINIPAFQHHPYNFRHSVVSEFIKRVGVSTFNQDIKRYEPLKSYFESRYDNVANLEPDTLFSTLDDLSQRRNDISHGVVVVDILSPLLVREYINFIDVYAQTINNILSDFITALKYSKSNSDLEKILIVKNKVLCCYVINRKIITGDKIIIRKKHSKPEFIETPILQIQIDKQTYADIWITAKTAVGFELSERISESDEFRFEGLYEDNNTSEKFS